MDVTSTSTPPNGFQAFPAAVVPFSASNPSFRVWTKRGLTLTAADDGKTIVCVNTQPIDVFIPSGLWISCKIVQGGAGAVNIRGIGMTIRAEGGKTGTSGQYQKIQLEPINVSEYLANGFAVPAALTISTKPIAPTREYALSRIAAGANPNHRFTQVCKVFDNWAALGNTRFGFGNRYGYTANTNALTFAWLRLEYPLNSGTWYPLTIGGSATPVLAAGSTKVFFTDPLALSMPGGSMFRIDGELSVPVNGFIPQLDWWQYRAVDGAGVANGPDAASIAVMPNNDSSQGGYGPCAIVGDSYAPFATALFMDSLGNNYPNTSGMGTPQQVLAGGMPYHNSSLTGLSLAQAANNCSPQVELAYQVGATHAIVGDGANDGNNYPVSTLASMQSQLKGLAYQLRYAGMAVTVWTVTTHTTSPTDNFASLGGQNIYNPNFSVGGLIDQYNAGILATPPIPVSQVCDIRPAFQTAANLIVSTGVPFDISPDGLHRTPKAASLIAAATPYDSAVYPQAITNPVPGAIARLTDYWDAEDLRATLADGDQVTSWVSAKLGIAATVAAGVLAPTFEANGTPNGKASVKFVGANNQRLVAPAANTTALANLFAGGGSFLIIYKVGASTAGRLVAKGNASGTNFASMNGATNTIKTQIGRATTAAAFALGNIAANVWHAYGIWNDSADLTIARTWSRNSLAAQVPSGQITGGAGTLADDTAINLVFGNRPDFASPWDGSIAGIYFWQNGETDAEMDAVKSYLCAQKGTLFD